MGLQGVEAQTGVRESDRAAAAAAMVTPVPLPARRRAGVRSKAA